MQPFKDVHDINPKTHRRFENYFFVKVTNGLLEITAVFDSRGNSLGNLDWKFQFSYGIFREATRIASIETTISGMNAFVGKTDNVTLVFRHRATLDQIVSVSAFDESLEGQLAYSAAMKLMKIESKGLTINLLSSENIENTSTGSAALDDLMAKYT